LRNLKKKPLGNLSFGIILFFILGSTVTKKSGSKKYTRAGPRNPQPYALLPLRPWVLTPLQTDSHPCALITAYLRTSHLPDLRSELRQTWQHNTRHKTRPWSCLSDECTQEKHSDSHYRIMYIAREHKHCPRTSCSSQPEGLIIPQNSLLVTPAAMS
jgi:hypothetical protein